MTAFLGTGDAGEGEKPITLCCGATGDATAILGMGEAADDRFPGLEGVDVGVVPGRGAGERRGLPLFATAFIIFAPSPGLPATPTLFIVLLVGDLTAPGDVAGDMPRDFGVASDFHPLGVSDLDCPVGDVANDPLLADAKVRGAEE